MKRIKTLLFLCICLVITISAQEKKCKNRDRGQFIEVIGVAEMSLNADTLTLSVCIREGKAAEKKSLATLETELLKDLETIGLKKEDIKVTDIGGVWRDENATNETPRKMAYFLTKTFSLKMGSIEQIDRLLETINRNNIDYVQISSLSNKKIKEYQQKIRIEALEAAREKANYLIKSQGKELGEILQIIEQEPNEGSPYALASSNTVLYQQNSAIGNLENFRKMNLRYKIKARFAIK